MPMPSPGDPRLCPAGCRKGIRSGQAVRPGASKGGFLRLLPCGLRHPCGLLVPPPRDHSSATSLLIVRGAASALPSHLRLTRASHSSSRPWWLQAGCHPWSGLSLSRGVHTRRGGRLKPPQPPGSPQSVFPGPASPAAPVLPRCHLPDVTRPPKAGPLSLGPGICVL